MMMHNKQWDLHTSCVDIRMWTLYDVYMSNTADDKRDITTTDSGFTVPMTLAEMHSILEGSLCLTLANDYTADTCTVMPDDVALSGEPEDKAADVEKMREAYTKLVAAARECSDLFHDLFDCR